jgi:hypothetical protein
MDAGETTAGAPVRLPRRRSPALAVLLGWLCPGLGQLYAGRAAKAAIFLVAVLPAFGLGWWLTDFTGVNPRLYTLDFFAQILAGGPTAGALHLSEGLTLEALPRWLDVGRLYLAVAGLLNLVAICDALGEVIGHNRRADALRAAWRARQSAEAVSEPPPRETAAAPASADVPAPEEPGAPLPLDPEPREEPAGEPAAGEAPSPHPRPAEEDWP